MATTMKTDAQKVADYRKQAMDKSLPQEVRDMADKKANEIEAKNAKKAGVNLAKGGMPTRGARTAANKEKKMMYGGMAEKKPAMAKGGMAKKAKK